MLIVQKPKQIKKNQQEIKKLLLVDNELEIQEYIDTELHSYLERAAAEGSISIRNYTLKYPEILIPTLRKNGWVVYVDPYATVIQPNHILNKVLDSFHKIPKVKKLGKNAGSAICLLFAGVSSLSAFLLLATGYYSSDPIGVFNIFILSLGLLWLSTILAWFIRNDY